MTMFNNLPQFVPVFNYLLDRLYNSSCSNLADINRFNYYITLQQIHLLISQVEHSGCKCDHTIGK